MKTEGSYPGRFINIVTDGQNIEGVVSDFPPRLSIGEVFRAQVLEVFSNEILLGMPDGSKFKATSKVDLNVERGDVIKFLISDRDENKVFLERITHDRKTSFEKKTHLNAKYIDTQINKVTNLQKDIGFIDEINKYCTFVQIPLNKWNNEASGELYILKRNKDTNKANTVGILMFMVLNTKNLKTIESLILVNKHDVNITMRFEDKKILEFFRKNQSELCKSLSAIGFRMLSLKCDLSDEDVEISSLHKKINKMLHLNKVSIDIRV